MKNARSKTAAQRPIGVFDSGVGGLTVVKALMQELPLEDIVYFGDTARVPYGTKSKEAIIRFSRQNADLLLKRKVKMIVVACNSSSSHALTSLKKHCPVPVMDVIGPGVRRAAEATKNNKVGVIATPATINSGAYLRQLKRRNASISVISQACPLFVPLVEEGWFSRSVTEQVAEEYLANIKKFRVDTLILGCTHYPLLKAVLRRVMGLRVTLVDSAQEVANDVKRYLDKSQALRTGSGKPAYHFLVSDESKHFRQTARRFLGYDIKSIEQVKF